MFRHVARQTIPITLLIFAGCQDQPLPTDPAARTAAFDHVAGHCVVSSLLDNGAGTLREAIADANCATITFAVTGTITTDSTLQVFRAVTITGPGADELTIARNFAPGTPKFAVLAVWSNTTSLSGVSITNGHNLGHGGGIFVLSQLFLANSRVYGNTADGVGGGIATVGATSTITGSAITHNHAVGRGGGIRAFTSLKITNSTVSHNTSDDAGAAIGADAPVDISHSTIFGNAAINGGLWGPGGMTFRNSIIANNTLVNCFALIFNGGYNIDSGNSCGFSVANQSLSNTDAQLGALADNGGTTPTHALPVGSPAIDAGVCTDLDNNNVATDQRGLGRPQPNGGACDIGAYELDRFDFTGFFAPIDNLPTVNVAKAGSAIPVKFSLGTDEGLDIFAAGYPQASLIACDTSDPLDQVTETVTAGGSSLTYDAVTNRYVYVWKTDKAWAGSCRELTLTFIEGTTVTAQFKFTK